MFVDENLNYLLEHSFHNNQPNDESLNELVFDKDVAKPISYYSRVSNQSILLDDSMQNTIHDSFMIATELKWLLSNA